MFLSNPYSTYHNVNFADVEKSVCMNKWSMYKFKPRGGVTYCLLRSTTPVIYLCLKLHEPVQQVSILQSTFCFKGQLTKKKFMLVKSVTVIWSFLSAGLHKERFIKVLPYYSAENWFQGWGQLHFSEGSS